tara:strand:- start:1081 stop:1866 length:786 start_codon:yes stop_codon:yes gene_type:complete
MKNMGYEDLEDLNKNPKDVIEFLKEKYENINGLKTRLSSLYVITENKEYHTDMMDNIQKYNTETNKQEKNDKQKENWMTAEEIQTIYDQMETSIKPLWKKKDLTTKEILKIQDFVILSLFTLIPPRRAMDYIEFKINNINTNKDNYIKGNNLVFNTFKTSKQKGTQTIKIPKQLKSILTKYIKLITDKSDYLIFNNKFQQLSTPNFTLRLNKIFGNKKVSVNMLRHIYLSEKHATNLKDMKEDFESMGSSLKQSNVYIKND